MMLLTVLLIDRKGGEEKKSANLAEEKTIY